MRRGKMAAQLLRTLFITILLLLVCFPFLQMLSTAFKSEQEQFAIPVTLFPKDWTLENFSAAIAYEPFSQYFLNSLFVSAVSTALTLAVALFGAYGFTRTDFPGRRFFLILVLFAQMVCLAAIAVPIYRIIGTFGLNDSYLGLIICYLSFTTPVAIWMLRSFILGVPIELEQAAQIDGATRLSAFFRVVVPVLKPGISASGSYVFFLCWQEFLFSLIVMTDQSKRTLPVGIMDYVGQYETNWGTLMASSIILALPVFVIFFFVQKNLIAGLTEGAVKG